MKKKILILFVVILQNQFLTFAVVENAYWYNFSPLNVIFSEHTIEQQSYLEIVGNDSLPDILNIEAIFNNRKTIFKQTVELNDNLAKSLISSNLYSYFFKVPYFEIPPIQIVIKDESGTCLKTIECNYYKLDGYVKSELPHKKLYIGIVPNNFSDPDLLTQVQPDGYYSILLPLRHYNAFYAVADSYGKQTLETWTYNILGNKNITLNFNIQNIEIYNLHTWENNGGGKSLFIVFRPMLLSSYTNQELNIENETFNEFDFHIDLKKENLEISIDNEILNIISVQSFYETGSKDAAIKSYIVQVEYDKRFRNKLLTVKINHNDSFGNSRIFLNKL